MMDMKDWKNQLYYGDNLNILREYIPDESVDLIYLDPPFNSQATYNVLFAEKNGSAAASQVKAFEDSWHWDLGAEAVFQEIVTKCPKRVADLVISLRSFMGQNDMMAYLTMMAIRLVEMRRVLKQTGSIYLHCDPTASHYLKLVMDAIFGFQNIRNEIIWKRTQPKSHAYTRFSRSHDVLLYYGKTDNVTFFQQFTEHDPEYVNKFYHFIEPETGRRYRLGDLTNPNKNRPHLTYEFPPGSGTVRVWRWTKERMMKAWEEGIVVIPPNGGVASGKRYLDEMQGNPVTDIWDDIEHLHGLQHEQLGYPTQKPEALLERIIAASSNVGDVIMDPFCGCGTAVSVAEKLNRRWIGIDITHLAIALIKHRLEDSFDKELAPYEIIGVPKDLKSAEALAQQDKYQFQWWALSLIDARPAGEQKKGADAGIDGTIYFFDDDSGKAKKVVVQVKGGHHTVSQIRDLKGVMERDKAEIGIFIALQQPTKPMMIEAVAAGFYESPIYKDKKYPRLQILTIEELLAGKQIEMPRFHIDTFKKAELKGKKKYERVQLLPD
jgi:site-specific DNA-methyltransferase (adenine-specific)